MDDELKLFRVDFDSSEYYIEAGTMRAAISVWHAYMQADQGSDWCGDEEPESCALINGAPVLRAAASPPAVAAVAPTLADRWAEQEDAEHEGRL